MLYRAKSSVRRISSHLQSMHIKTDLI